MRFLVTIAVPISDVYRGTRNSQDAENVRSTKCHPKPTLEATFSGDKKDEENSPSGKCAKHPPDHQRSEEAPNPEDGRIQSLWFHSSATTWVLSRWSDVFPPHIQTRGPVSSFSAWAAACYRSDGGRCYQVTAEHPWWVSGSTWRVAWAMWYWSWRMLRAWSRTGWGSAVLVVMRWTVATSMSEVRVQT